DSTPRTYRAPTRPCRHVLDRPPGANMHKKDVESARTCTEQTPSRREQAPERRRVVTCRLGAQGSADDVVPEGGGLGSLGDHPRLEGYGAAARPREQPGPVAEQHRDDEDHHLVEEPGLETAAGRLGAEDVDVLVARGLARGSDARLDVGDEGQLRVVRRIAR